MRKLVSILLLLNALPALAGKKQDGPDFKGRVKSISETHKSVVKASELTMSTIQSFHWKYDERGRLTEVSEKNITSGGPSGDNVYTTVKLYSYNEKGLLTGIRASTKSLKTEEKFTLTEYVYDDDGRRVLEIYTADETKNKRTLYTISYDHNGKLSEIITLTNSDESAGFKEVGRQKNTYDLDGNVAEVHYYDTKTGKFNIGKSSVYDGKKNVIEQKHFYSDGNLRLKQKFVYDKNDRIIETIDEYGNGGQSKNQTSYENIDDKGNYLKVATISPKSEEPLVTERVIEYYQ